jgi:hypothetical protein
MASKLTQIPNVGPAVATKLERLDVAGLDDLRGRDPHELFERLCALDGRRHDPCLLDTFVAAVAYADGGPARPWWEFSRERKARACEAELPPGEFSRERNARADG